MARTFIRQDTQIRNSDLYDDTIAPSLANFETNPTEIETDLNNIRSMLSHLLDVQVGNWYDVVNTPSALDPGAQRGVNDLNTDLHALERKRVLVASCNLADIAIAASVHATGTLTGTADFSDTETVTIGSKTYTFQAVLTNVDGNVQIDGTLAGSLQNLYDAINLTGTPGTQYAAAMTIHPTVSATTVTATTVVVTAKKGGTFGNTIATTETAANASWGGATLSGGSGGDVVELGVGEIPSNTTAAVGAVTTRGTVVATATTFLTAGLDEVAGTTAIAPKNVVEVVDATSRDPLLSGNRVIYGLLQGSSDLADGDTILDAGANDRVQVTFVRINATGDDLETIDGDDLGGLSVNLCFSERKALEDLNEQDFLRGAVVDIPGAQTVTRQVAYDNQGTVPVDVTTNSTLDLEGPGLYWEIRDDLQATLFRITEGSAGGTTTLALSSDVDTFDNNAVLNDFANPLKVDTAGTEIDIGVTAGYISTTGAADLGIRAGGELYLDDGNQTGSSWAQVAGIKLSDTTAEWNDFETAFGEVSLLNAIVQAANTAGGQRLSKTYANVTVDTVADTDVSLADGNLDTALPDMSAGSFLSDYDVFLNGELLRPGANSGANNDYYPGTALTPAAQLKFEFKVKTNDVLCVIAYG